MTALQRRAYQGHIKTDETRNAKARACTMRERVPYICLLGRKNPHSSLKAA